jgi:hypothetical protein
VPSLATMVRTICPQSVTVSTAPWLISESDNRAVPWKMPLLMLYSRSHSFRRSCKPRRDSKRMTPCRRLSGKRPFRIARATSVRSAAVPSIDASAAPASCFIKASWASLHFSFWPSSSTAEKVRTICARGSEVISARFSRRTAFAAGPKPISSFSPDSLRSRQEMLRIRCHRRLSIHYWKPGVVIIWQDRQTVDIWRDPLVLLYQAN